jgi:hypothetical protein
MITSLNEYRKYNESLSSDNQRAAKLATLVELGRQMVKNYKLAEEQATLKAEKNAEVAELLARMNKTSVIAEGVLIEVYKPYETKRLSSKAYFDFVNNSVGVISEDFKTLSETIKSISTKLSGGSKYIRTTKNTRDVPTGTVKTTESLSSIWDSIKEWFVSVKNMILGMLPGMEAKLTDIKNEAVRFQNDSEMVDIKNGPSNKNMAFVKTESNKAQMWEFYYRDTNGVESVVDTKIMRNPENSKHYKALQEKMLDKDDTTCMVGYRNYGITEGAAKNNYVLEDTIEGFLKPYIKDGADYTLDDDDNTVMLYIPASDMLFDIKDIHAPEWNILKLAFQEFCNQNDLYDFDVTTTDGDTEFVLSADVDIVDTRGGFTSEATVNEDLTPEQIAARNAYSKEYKRNRREQDKAIADVLVKAKEAIEISKTEAYYNELAATNEKMIIQLLEELNAKSVAIDDKILTIVKTEEKEAFDMKVYEEKITNAEAVGDAVAKMAKALMEIHKSTSAVSGSVRHIGDTSDSPEGTFNAHFDHETKTVIPPTSESVTNEGLSSWIMDSWKTIKGFFTSFRNASKSVDTSLAAI